MTQPLGPSDGTFVVTIRDVWSELRVMSAKIDSVAGQVSSLDSKVADVVADAHDHEVRIRALEKARWPLPSLAVIVSIAAIIVSVLVAFHK